MLPHTAQAESYIISSNVIWTARVLYDNSLDCIGNIYNQCRCLWHRIRCPVCESLSIWIPGYSHTIKAAIICYMG